MMAILPREGRPGWRAFFVVTVNENLTHIVNARSALAQVFVDCSQFLSDSVMPIDRNARGHRISVARSHNLADLVDIIRLRVVLRNHCAKIDDVIPLGYSRSGKAEQ